MLGGGHLPPVPGACVPRHQGCRLWRERAACRVLQGQGWPKGALQVAGEPSRGSCSGILPAGPAPTSPAQFLAPSPEQQDFCPCQVCQPPTPIPARPPPAPARDAGSRGPPAPGPGPCWDGCPGPAVGPPTHLPADHTGPDQPLHAVFYLAGEHPSPGSQLAPVPHHPSVPRQGPGWEPDATQAACWGPLPHWS